MFIVIILLFSVATNYGMTKEEQNYFTALQQRSDTFFELPIANHVAELPNRIKTIVGDDINKQKRIVWQAQNTRPIFHPKLLSLSNDFLAFKKKYANAIEQKIYTNMEPAGHIERCFKKRPIMFMGATDSYILRNNVQNTSRIVSANDWEDKNNPFDAIGTDHEQKNFHLAEYIAYHEMQISALLGVSVPTFFINNGNRHNAAQPSTSNDYETEGIYIGLVGARFERANRMEWQHMLVTKEYSTQENGYGENNNSSTLQAQLLKIWAKFYEVPFFPTYQQAKQDSTGRYLQINNKNLSDHPVYLDTDIYKKRMFLTISSFLYEANRRGEEEQRQAYCHTVGLGLGVWAINSDEQAKLMLDVYYDIISKYKFPCIADIDFSWFPKSSENYWKNKPAFNRINIIFSQRNPAAKLTGDDTGKLLVAMYAWDGNAYPGNEYWCPMLQASGDPAAACCSTIAELQNPDINEDMINNINPQIIEYHQDHTQYPSFDDLVFTYKKQSFLHSITENLLLIGSILIIPLLLYCYKKGILTKN